MCQHATLSSGVVLDHIPVIDAAVVPEAVGSAVELAAVFALKQVGGRILLVERLIAQISSGPRWGAIR